MRLVILTALVVTMIAGWPYGARSSPPPLLPPTPLQNTLAAARGALGTEHLASIRGWHVSADTHSTGLNGTSDSWIDRSGGAEATYVKLPPVSQDTGYNGHAAWTRDVKGVVIVDGSVAGRSAAINALYRDTYELWMHDLGGARAEFLGRRAEANVTYDIVRVTPAHSLVPFDYWFNSVTHLPSRSVETSGPITTTTTFANYQRTSVGMRIPFSQQMVDSQGNATAITVDRVDVDPGDMKSRVRKPRSSVHDFSISQGAQTRVPFQLIDNHVYLDVMLAGKGPYRFIFDTGGANIIDPSVARELGTAAVGSVQGGGVGASTEQLRFARITSVRIGNAEVRDQVFAVVPVRAGFGVAGSAAVDGLIGWEVLARFVTTFDYGARRITFHLPGSAQLPGKPVHFDFGETQPQAPCTIDGIATVCAIDTGSRASIDLFSPFIASHPRVVPASASSIGLNGYGLGGGEIGRLGRLSTLVIGGYELKSTIAGFSASTKGAFAGIGVGANVGGGLLRRFRVNFDYPHQKMSLVPNAAFGEPDTYDRSGVFVINHNGRLAVVDVRPGTPAAAAGLKKGDVFASIDDGIVATLTLRTLRAAFHRPAGTIVHLRIVSGPSAVPHRVRLTLRDYV